MIHSGRVLADKGYAVMLVSLPGYGQSQGTPDQGRFDSFAAAHAALEQLERKPGVRATRVGVWGVDEGANVALYLALKHPEVRAVVLQSGLYGSKLELGPPAPGKDRSSATLLMIHGAKDAESPASEAGGLAVRLGTTGMRVEQQILPGATHAIPPGDGSRRAATFFVRELAR
jgi:predicted esterase